ncbi:MAG: hypothetical protein PH343_08250 [Nitrospira sp.]|nr:hypothetical protein [Nitrospira sp.]
MKRLKIILMGCAIMACLNAYSAEEGFARYNVILQRKPFGTPPDSSTNILSSALNDKFKNIKLVEIIQGVKGIKVGLVDISSNPQKCYYLGIGESEDGWKIVDADFEMEGADVEKDGEKRWLTLSGMAYGGGINAPPIGIPNTTATPSINAGGSSSGSESYIEKLKKRREARVKIAKEPELKGESLDKHLEQMNMDIIRAAAKGGDAPPPLPMELTPEQDKQLVEEGVLPPNE